MNTAKQILGNSLQNLISTIINRIGGLIFTIIVARLLAPELFGVYSLALAIMLLIFTFADLGLAQTLVRYVSDSLGQKNKTLARSYFKYLFKVKILSVLIFSLALFLLSKIISIYIFKNPELILPLQFSALYLFIGSILDFITFTFFATKTVKYFTVRELVLQPSRIILVPICIGLLAWQFKVAGIFAILAFSSLLALIVSFYYLKKEHSFLLKGKTIEIDKKRVLRFTLLLMIGILPGVFFTYIDSLMLGVMLPVKYVGFYRVAYMMATSVGSLMAFHLVLFPFFTQLKGIKLKNTFKKLFNFVSILAFPMAFGLALISKPFIKILFGEEYLAATLPLYILAFIVIDMALFSYFATLFQAKEKPEVPTKLVAIAAIINIILNYFLIKFFAGIRIDLGMLGAAIATFISRYFYGFALAFAASKQFKVKPDFSSIYKPLIASIGMSIFLIFIMAIIPTKTIWIGFLEIFLAAIVYFIFLFLLKGIHIKDF
ncbi:MAG: oligosaccharide flippase family protein, partial [Nanoarchaeota archaeon]|nr:oligosaccharide flippase family protein [Nanoarchaeota archaeon]